MTTYVMEDTHLSGILSLNLKPSPGCWQAGEGHSLYFPQQTLKDTQCPFRGAQFTWEQPDRFSN